MTKNVRTARVLLVLAGLFLGPLALQAVARKRAPARRHASEFRALKDPVITVDGAWIAAEARPDRGDGYVRVWSTEGGATFSIERGQNPRISSGLHTGHDVPGRSGRREFTRVDTSQ